MFKILLCACILITPIISHAQKPLTGNKNSLATIKKYKTSCIAQARSHIEVNGCYWDSTHAAIESANKIINKKTGENPDSNDIAIATRKIYKACDSYDDTILGAFAETYKDECKFFAATAYLEIAESR